MCCCLFFGGERVAQWWKLSPLTNVARVRLQTSMPYVWRVCCWFSLFCSERFFCGYSSFPLSSKTNFSKFQFDQDHVDEEPLIIVICSKPYYRVFSTVFLYIPTGGSLDQAPTPLDGMNLWNTISNGDPSPRKEILLNSDVEPQTENSFRKLSTDIYEGIALRAGDMKLLLSVPNASWYKPPELGGDSSVRQYTPFDKNDKLGWFQDGAKVFSSKDIFL